MNKKNLIALTVTVVSLVLIGAGCSSATTANNPTTPTASTDQTGQTAVAITNFSFQSGTITVPAGTTVVWTNKDSVTHTVTADDNSFDSGNLAVNGTYSRTFTQPGSYPYHCAIHPSMKGTVIVQ